MRAIVNETVLSARTEPSSHVALDDELLYGMIVEVLDETVDEEGEIWVHERPVYRFEDYCKKSGLFFGEERVREWDEKARCVIMQPYADVLSEPRVQGVCLQSLSRGSRVIRLGEAPDRPSWIEVELVDGRRGYTKEKFLGPYYDKPFTDDEEEFRKRVVEIAKSYMGVQYRWGGKSTLGIDCSGLTSISYLLCGVYTFRNAQLLEGYPVHKIAYEDKKPGDLLYFPGHIAMYLGDDRYIHSTGHNGSDGVVINSLNPEDPDYRQDLVDMLTDVGSIW